MARFEGRREDAEMMQVLRGKSRRRRTDFDGFSDIGAASQLDFSTNNHHDLWLKLDESHKLFTTSLHPH